MRSQIKWIILVVFVLLSPVCSHAVSSMPWSTTFNYGPCSQQGGGGQPNCGTTTPDGIYFNWGGNAVSGNYTQVTSEANYPGGAGGNGMRSWLDDTANEVSGSVRIDFPSPQKEFWLRWYERWQVGAKWDWSYAATTPYHKSMYLRSNGTSDPYAGFYGRNGYRLYNQGSTGGLLAVTPGGWETVYPTGISDGSWHAWEIHMKMDTNNTNGVGQVWMDGVLIGSKTDFNWSNGDTASRAGWTWFSPVENNQGTNNGGAIYIDIDDMAIQNTTPSNKDAQGNPYIGLIGRSVGTAPPPATVVNGACGSASGQSFTSLTSASPNLCSTGTVASFTGSGPWSWGCNGSSGGTSTSGTACFASLASTLPTPPATQLFSESFENNSYASRGWYDNTNHGTVVTGGQSGNALQWSWASAATTPTNGGSMRRAFTPTDSLYLSYYVKFQTGWRGSQKAYHPHMLYILSDLDNTSSIYSPLANNYLQTYVEFLSDIGSPYTIRPQIAIQDEKRVNTSYGTPPNNLTAVTENRSVAYCNTPVSAGAAGTCYADNPYYSANTWKASTASISTNAWHHVEVYLKMNTISGGKGQSNGIMQEWIDGVQVINRSDVLYRTAQDATKKWAQFVLAPYIGDGSPIAQSMWIDELTAATAPPGSAAIIAPTGLKIKTIVP